MLHEQLHPVGIIDAACHLPGERKDVAEWRAKEHVVPELIQQLLDRGFEILSQGKPVLYCGRSNIGAYAALTRLPAVTAEQYDTSRREPVACEVVQ